MPCTVLDGPSTSIATGLRVMEAAGQDRAAAWAGLQCSLQFVTLVLSNQ